MKKYITYFGLMIMLILAGCREDHTEDQIIFGVENASPPFVYHDKNGELQGFDVELSKLLASELKKKAIIKTMPFGNLLPSLESGKIHMLPTIPITMERKNKVDFSYIYYHYNFVLINNNNYKYKEKKIAYELGTSGKEWLKQYKPKVEIIHMEDNTQMIEALNAGHIDAILIDKSFAKIICTKNKNFSYKDVNNAKFYGAIALKKRSSLREPINAILKKLEENGGMAKLKLKWGLEDSELETSKNEQVKLNN